ncbi:hypothetical protein [Chamaesiphon sp. VAR_69_metabat_338]|uniref:hypothetical protein n=1 Tax=Chamaesiphon sp. VAR_69_metabat_338 TaxID=2964704 RepID=UPI00286E1D5B|nr:hypothetical protein [Chamaesiphon sp. VAR_69_metabat_338]
MTTRFRSGWTAEGGSRLCRRLSAIAYHHCLPTGHDSIDLILLIEGNRVYRS